MLDSCSPINTAQNTSFSSTTTYPSLRRIGPIGLWLDILSRIKETTLRVYNIEYRSSHSQQQSRQNTACQVDQDWLPASLRQVVRNHALQQDTTRIYAPITEHPHVIFVGAGPVALWTAILMKVNNATVRIRMFEKNTAYARNHELKINPKSLNNVPFHEKLNPIVKSFKERIFVPINEIETTLRKLAEELGVVIINTEIARPDILPLLYSNTKLFVGADGSRSKVHQTVFEGRYRFKHVLNYAAKVDYRVENPSPLLFGVTPIIGWAKGSYRTFKAMKHLPLLEQRGKKDPRKMTLFLKIDEKTYEEMKSANLKNPYTLRDSRVPKDLADDVDLWCGVKRELHEENQLRSTTSVTVTFFQAYASKEFVKRDTNGKTWCLVGDAAAGFPYQMGFNVGLEAGQKLADALSKACFSKEGEVSICFKDYNSYLGAKAEKTNKNLNYNQRLIYLFNFILATSRMAPIQTCVWSPDERQKFIASGRGPLITQQAS